MLSLCNTYVKDGKRYTQPHTKTSAWSLLNVLGIFIRTQNRSSLDLYKKDNTKKYENTKNLTAQIVN
ncbi:hypothetical protein SB49_15665 [Sediminicola sp. YIK13]|nr:hypothetical protein SB49_15665 [Sediminicola sp. YIK13]